VSFFDRVKKGAGTAADKAKQEVSELQTKNELVKTYELLGKKTYELADKGALQHEELNEIVTRVRELREKLEDLQLS
jgi:uncharacterized phage infection (PIP) family protein YhgE